MDSERSTGDIAQRPTEKAKQVAKSPGIAPWRWWGLRRYYALTEEPASKAQDSGPRKTMARRLS